MVAFGQGAEGEFYVLTNGRNLITGNTGKLALTARLKPSRPPTRL